MIQKAQNKEEVILTLDKDDMIGKTLLPLYIYVAEYMGYEDNAIEMYDCRKIWVAQNVQDAIIEAYRRRCPDEYAKHPMEVDQEIIKILAMGGPKMNRDLQNNQVKVEAGFIIFKETAECEREAACG